MCKIESCSEKDSGDNSDNKKKTFTEKVSERLKDIMGEKGIDITRLSEAIGRFQIHDFPLSEGNESTENRNTCQDSGLLSVPAGLLRNLGKL